MYLYIYVKYNKYISYSAYICTSLNDLLYLSLSLTTWPTGRELMNSCPARCPRVTGYVIAVCLRSTRRDGIRRDAPRGFVTSVPSSIGGGGGFGCLALIMRRGDSTCAGVIYNDYLGGCARVRDYLGGCASVRLLGSVRECALTTFCNRWPAT